MSQQLRDRVVLYAASKAALQAASVSLDREYAPRGVRVFLVEMHSTLGTDFSAGFDPQHMAIAAATWTNLGIAWDRDAWERLDPAFRAYAPRIAFDTQGRARQFIGGEMKHYIPVPEGGKGIAPGRGLVLWLSVGWGILGLHIQGKGIFGIPEQATFTGSLAGERSPVT